MAEQAPPGIDPTVPSVARIYDYLLGGKDNFAADRAAAEKLIELTPNVREGVRGNRRFLSRAVRFLADSGIRQFLDIGAGLPTQENVHEVALRAAPDSHIVYVDNDPIVLTHGRALLADYTNTIVVDGDLRNPAGILDDPRVTGHLDFSKPVAVLLVAILHFIDDNDEAAEIMRVLRERLVPGSGLVISHVSFGDLRDDEIREMRQLYKRSVGQPHPRTYDEVLSFFEGFDLVEPGLFSGEWRGDPDDPPLPQIHGVGGYVGVGLLRADG